MRRTPSGRATSAPAALLLAACLVAITPSPAQAHTSLATSTPSAGATVVQPLEVVQLVFTSAVSAEQAQVVLTAPDGTDVAQGPARVSGATVGQSVDAWPASGSYRLAYRVLAQDGHPITGRVPFTVDPAAVTSAPAALPTDGATAPAQDPVPVASAAQPAPEEGGGWLVPGLAAGLALAVIALGGALVRSSRRSQVGA